MGSCLFWSKSSGRSIWASCALLWPWRWASRSGTAVCRRHWHSWTRQVSPMAASRNRHYPLFGSSVCCLRCAALLILYYELKLRKSVHFTAWQDARLRQVKRLRPKNFHGPVSPPWQGSQEKGTLQHQQSEADWREKDQTSGRDLSD